MSEEDWENLDGYGGCSLKEIQEVAQLQRIINHRRLLELEILEAQRSSRLKND